MNESEEIALAARLGTLNAAVKELRHAVNVNAKGGLSLVRALRTRGARITDLERRLKALEATVDQIAKHAASIEGATWLRGRLAAVEQQLAQMQTPVEQVVSGEGVQN